MDLNKFLTYFITGVGSIFFIMNLVQFFFLIVLRKPRKCSEFNSQIGKHLLSAILLMVAVSVYNLHQYAAIYALSWIIVSPCMVMVYADEETNAKYAKYKTSHDFYFEKQDFDAANKCSIDYYGDLYSNLPWHRTATEFFLPIVLTTFHFVVLN